MQEMKEINVNEGNKIIIRKKLVMAFEEMIFIGKSLKIIIFLLIFQKTQLNQFYF